MRKTYTLLAIQSYTLTQTYINLQKIRKLHKSHAVTQTQNDTRNNKLNDKLSMTRTHKNTFQDNTHNDTNNDTNT